MDYSRRGQCIGNTAQQLSCTYFDEAILLLKHANIEDVEIINQAVADLAGDTAQELCDGIREL